MEAISSVQSVQSLSRVRLFATPWIAARQASLSVTNSRSLLRLMSIELVMPSNHLILCRPLLLLPSIFPSIRVFSSESAVHIRWPKYRNFSFNISPSNEYSGLISFRIFFFLRPFKREMGDWRSSDSIIYVDVFWKVLIFQPYSWSELEGVEEFGEGDMHRNGHLFLKLKFWRFLKGGLKKSF